MRAVLDNLQGLGRTRLLLLGGVGAAIVIAIVAMSLIMSQASTTVLYAGLERGEAARMGQALQDSGIAFDVQEDGTALLVDPENARQARMLLAERGLPSSGGAGYELFDDQGALGLTSFMQKITRTRALEGELARTVQTLDSVKAARVHLVLPDREAFSRTAAKPTASVIVRTASGEGLSKEKAAAVQHLVASSVPSLQPADVTVLDSSGEVLAAQADAGSAVAGRIGDMKIETEGRMVRAVEELLTPYLGLGNFRVMVTADMDMDREVVSEETFDPDSRVERSYRTLSEAESTTDTSFEPPVTVEQNLPAAEVDNAPGSSSNAETQRSEETINYEISSLRRERVREGGEIERLSVAVLVNGSQIEDPAGETTYQPRSAEELTRIASIVRTAVGFDEARGDVVTVENVEFQTSSLEIDPVGAPSLSEVLLKNLGSIIQSVVLLVVVGLLTLFGLKPLLSRLLPQRRQAAADEEESQTAPALAEAEGVAAVANESVKAEMKGVSAPAGEALSDARGQKQLPPRIGGRSDMDRWVDNMIELKAVEGRVRESSLSKLGEIVEHYPEEAVGVLRAWIYEGRPA